MTTPTSCPLSISRGFTLFFLLCFLPTGTTAKNHWECQVRDSENREWTGSSGWKRAAFNHAFESCKKESSAPASCQAVGDECDSALENMLSPSTWYCVALDHMAATWTGGGSPSQEDAALSALNQCRHASSFPDTCHLNTITCHDDSVN